jgi:hypothetical protein
MTATQTAEPELDAFRVCAQRPGPVPELRSDLGFERTRAIISGRSKWANGTVLRYHFFDRQTDGEEVVVTGGGRRFVSWVGPERQREVVRAAFGEWMDLGIGLRFMEIDDRAEAEIRIGFMAGDGAWSLLGRDVLGAGVDERTMNFGWSLTDAYGRSTARHEIGHTIGMPHEHQNPFAGIEWDEARVYEFLSGPPNNWDRGTIHHNVLRKLAATEVDGSTWDPDSIMEYAFPAGLIVRPERYRTEALRPPGTISPIDRQWALTWYPPQGPEPPPTLEPFLSRPLDLKPRQQADLVIVPAATRRYQVATFGASDTVLTLFEEVDGQLRFRAGDDDSGEDRNAHLEEKLFQGRRYVVRVRLYYTSASGQTAVMYW